MPNNNYPDPFIVNPNGEHTHTLILLHGRGDTGSAFGAGVYITRTSSGFSLASLYPGMKFIFPTTKQRYTTGGAAAGYWWREWFDTTSLEYPEEEPERQVEGLREAVTYVNGLIEAEVANGIPRERIIIGGLSQGCATSIHVLLAQNERMGGFVGMSGWMPFASRVREICGLSPGFGVSAILDSEEPVEVNNDESDDEVVPEEGDFPEPPPEKQKEALMFIREALLGRSRPRDDRNELEVLKTPVFLGHGDEGLLYPTNSSRERRLHESDEVVDYKLGRNIYTTLRHGLGMDVTWKRYRNFGHWYKVFTLPF
ncbi:Alpha/Beta hydrolase protein [Pyronema omphalodes]|nr:Alpha/Beta hydrolase protein [Pyronema omphalodes]